MSFIDAMPAAETTNTSSVHPASTKCVSNCQANDAEADAVAALAHDLRNFMQCVQMSVCVLKSSPRRDKQLRDTLDVLERDSKTAVPQLNDLIAIARQAAGREENERRNVI